MKKIFPNPWPSPSGLGVWGNTDRSTQRKMWTWGYEINLNPSREKIIHEIKTALDMLVFLSYWANNHHPVLQCFICSNWIFSLKKEPPPPPSPSNCILAIRYWWWLGCYKVSVTAIKTAGKLASKNSPQWSKNSQHPVMHVFCAGAHLGDGEVCLL